MVVWKIALNNIKRVFGNLAILPMLLFMPIFQIFIMSTILDGISPQGSSVEPAGGLVQVIVLEQVRTAPVTHCFASSTLVQFLLIAGIIAAAMVISDREGNTLMRVFAAPVKRSSIVLGNLLGQSLITLIVAVVVIGITYLFMDISWGSSWLNVLIVTLAIILTTTSLGFVFSAIFKNEKISTAIMSFFVIVMTFLSDGFTFGGQFGMTSKFTINKWGYDAYIKLMEGRPLESIMPNLAVLGAVALALIIIASLLYRRENIYE